MSLGAATAGDAAPVAVDAAYAVYVLGTARSRGNDIRLCWGWSASDFSSNAGTLSILGAGSPSGIAQSVSCKDGEPCAHILVGEGLE